MENLGLKKNFTSSNFLALYCSAPFRKFSNMMSHSTVPYIIVIITVTGFVLAVFTIPEWQKTYINMRELKCMLLLSHIPIRLTTPTDVKAATMLISVGIMLNFPAYKRTVGFSKYECYF